MERPSESIELLSRASSSINHTSIVSAVDPDHSDVGKDAAVRQRQSAPLLPRDTRSVNFNDTVNTDVDQDVHQSPSLSSIANDVSNNINDEPVVVSVTQSSNHNVVQARDADGYQRLMPQAGISASQSDVHQDICGTLH